MTTKEQRLAEVEQLLKTNICSEDPFYFRSHWKHEVCVDNTQLGYWDWVKQQIESE